ncbi:hypothetical protein AB0N89_36095 [Amycolatopsis sp. NPDC089917]|uniref:hypothetical protein n=1 Tax=Amycolatopsis sp. NPDC089917 TaxID=3155187 RepID=UPI003422A7CB
MRRREFTAAEVDELDRDVAELAWRWARRLTGLPAEQAPFGPVDPRISDKNRADAHLARLYVLTRLRQCADARSDADVFHAQQAGAAHQDVVKALDLS